MMVKARLFILWTIIAVLGVACDLSTQSEPLPTLAVLPTLPPTATLTATDTPTITPIPSETFTPTTTPSPTATATFTPTVSLTPSVTVTSSITPTPTSTATATASPTPPATATPVMPIIVLFDANVANAKIGDQVTLRWQTESDSVRLERLNAQGIIMETIPVTTSGTYLATVPGDSGAAANYRLVAIRLQNETAATVTVNIACATNWFFGNQFVSGCPNGAAVSVLGASQPFQTGLMAHVNFSNQNRICGLQNDASQYLCYENLWDNVTIEPYTPPAGLFAPQQMFNWLYKNTLASGGLWDAKLGWATANIDNNPITYQLDANGKIYFNTPQGVYFLNGTTSGAGTWSGTWTKIK